MTRNERKCQQQLELADRLREIREDLVGECGGQLLADALEIPLETWQNYESGDMVPVKVVLQLLVMARISHDWLLTGQGAKFDQKSQQYAAGPGEP
jgi:hypothetical protein